MLVPRYAFKLLTVAVVFAIGFHARDCRAQNPVFLRYKEQMMPKVGKKISVSGILQSGKLGWFLASGGWGIYIYATTDSSAQKQIDLNPFFRHRVTVTGTLLYRVGSHPIEPAVAGVPEH